MQANATPQGASQGDGITAAVLTPEQAWQEITADVIRLSASARTPSRRPGAPEPSPRCAPWSVAAARGSGQRT